MYRDLIFTPSQKLLLQLLFWYPIVDISRRVFDLSAFLYIIIDFYILLFLVLNFPMKIKINGRPWLILISIYILFVSIYISLISTIHVENINNFIVYLVEVKFYLYLIYPVVIMQNDRISNYCDNVFFQKKFMKFLVGFLLLYIPLSFLQVIYGTSLPELIQVKENAFRSVLSSMVHLSSGPFFVPKRAARYLLVLLMMCFLFSKKPKFSHFTILILIFLTGSREAFILSMALFMIMILDRKIMKKAFLPMLLLLVVFIYYNSKAGFFFFGHADDWINRISSLFFIFSALGDYITLFGYGPAAYTQLGNVMNVESGFDLEKFHLSNPILFVISDSYLVKIVIQFGVIGLFLTILLFCFILAGSFVCFARGNKVSGFSGIYLLISLLKVHIVSTDAFFVFATFLIYSLGINQIEREISPRTRNFLIRSN